MLGSTNTLIFNIPINSKIIINVTNCNIELPEFTGHTYGVCNNPMQNPFGILESFSDPSNMGCLSPDSEEEKKNVARHIIWNYPEDIHQLKLGGEIRGSILAPRANIETPDSGVIWGQRIIQSWNGPMQFNLLPFDTVGVNSCGCLPK